MASNGQGTFDFTPRMTLEEARAYVRAHLVPGGQGVRCPCCGQHCKLYKRPLHWGVAWALVQYYLWNRRHPGEPCPHGSWQMTRDHGFLKHWDLAYPYVGPDRAHGHWCITERGITFVEDRKMRLPAAAWVYNDQCFGYVDRDVTLTAALKKKFDLDELLRSAWEPSSPDDITGL
jgi:hypothetical protein